MIDEKDTIKCESIFDDTRTYRYLLKRVWDKTKPLVTVIMLHPCFSSNMITDLTTNLVINNVVKLEEYGGVNIVNLYAKMTEKMLVRWENPDRLRGTDNDEYIRKAALETEDVILAWGLGAEQLKSVCKRVSDVVSLLKELNRKLYVISDGERDGLHPLTPTIRSKWELKLYSEANNADDADDEESDDEDEAPIKAANVTVGVIPDDARTD